MKKHYTPIKLLCAAFAVTMSLSAAACTSNTTDSSSSTEPAVTVGADGYQLPYEYTDGYEAKFKTIDSSYYLTSATDKNGNKTVHFKTDKTQDEVKGFYDDYFKSLTPVVPKDENDNSKGYYDSEKRLVIYNLIVWEADGKTNYKMGTRPCDDINSDEVWKLADSDNASSDTKDSDNKADNSSAEPNE